MDAIRTDNYGGISDLLENMSTGIAMLEAFSTMLGYTLRSGDDNNNISWGAESIIRQQCQDFEFIRGALREQLDEIRKEKLAIKDIHQVAAMVGVPVETAALVVSCATGANFLDAVRPVPERGHA